MTTASVTAHDMFTQQLRKAKIYQHKEVDKRLLCGRNVVPSASRRSYFIFLQRVKLRPQLHDDSSWKENKEKLLFNSLTHVLSIFSTDRHIFLMMPL